MAKPLAAARMTPKLQMVGATRTWNHCSSSWENKLQQELGAPASVRACELERLWSEDDRWGIIWFYGVAKSNTLLMETELGYSCVFSYSVQKKKSVHACIMSPHCEVCIFCKIWRKSKIVSFREFSWVGSPFWVLRAYKGPKKYIGGL